MSRNRSKKHNHYESNTKLKSNNVEMCGGQKKEKYLQMQKKKENI